MKEAVIFSILFGIAFILFACITGSFGRRFDFYALGTGGHMYSRTHEISQCRQPDILFLGSSHAYRGFDPRSFSENGISSFNLGSSSQTPIQTELLLNQYLDVIQPKMVVFDVSPELMTMDGIESTADLISNNHIDFSTCKMAVGTHNVKIVNTLIYGILQEYGCDVRNKYAEPQCKNGDCYISGGYVERQDSSRSIKPVEKRSTQPNSKQLKAFERCLKMLKERNITFVLVRVPVTQTAYQSFENQEVYNERMANYGPFIDFNTVMAMDDRYFYDAQHMNQEGVVLFNQKFLEMVSIP